MTVGHLSHSPSQQCPKEMAAHWRISQGLHWAAWSALTDVTSPSIAVITVATTSPSPPPPDAPPDARERRLLRSRLESEPRSVLGSREQRAGSEVPGPTLPGGGRQASRQEGQETWASLQTAGEARPAVGQNRPEHASQGDGFAGVTEASRLQMEFILKEESQQDGDQEATEPEQRLGSRHPHPTPGRWPHGTHSPEPLCFWGQSGRHGGRGGAPSSVSFQMCSPAGSFVPGRRPTSLSASCALWGAPPGLCWASLTVCTVELMYLDHCLLPPVLRHLGPQSGTASYAYGFG